MIHVKIHVNHFDIILDFSLKVYEKEDLALCSHQRSGPTVTSLIRPSCHMSGMDVTAVLCLGHDATAEVR